MKKQVIRIALAQMNSVVGALKGNADKIISLAKEAQSQGADIVSFPELAVTGYPPEDLLFKAQFVDDNLEQLKRIAAYIGNIVCIVGFADRKAKALYNAAAVIHNARIKAYTIKRIFLITVFLMRNVISDVGRSFPFLVLAKHLWA